MDSVSGVSALTDTARDLTIEAAQSAGLVQSSNSRSNTRDLPFTQVKRLLDSRHDREILEGLRKVISMMYRSKPCLPFFSSIVKNVASPNIEVKKLVYIYLLHYAESEPDLALLSINTIQKSLSDHDSQVRAMALRVMSGIRVPVISQIVSLAIKKGCGDMSPHVRKASALAIPKCYRLDPSTLPQLTDYISTLLGDKQYYVVGSAIIAFLEICPGNIDLIHKHYRSLTRKLVDMDEWGQLALIQLLTRYARKCFPRRKGKSDEKKKADSSSAISTDTHEKKVRVALDPDLELFLKACKPLLSSRNSAVILSVTRCYLHIGTDEYLQMTIGPLFALLRAPQTLYQVILYNLVAVCMVTPASFVPYFGHFLVRSGDDHEIQRVKIELLTLIFTPADQSLRSMILIELEHFTKSTDKHLVRESVRAIGRCAHADAGMSNHCLNLLLLQTASTDDTLVAEALNVVRRLIQQDPSSHTNTVIRLAKNLDNMTDPSARASIIWLVGEFSGLGREDNIAPDVLRILLRGFAGEEETVRLQIVLLAAKVYSHHINRTKKPTEDTPQPDTFQGIGSNVERNVEKEYEASEKNGDHNTTVEATANIPNEEHPFSIMWNYTLLLARYDTSYDLRDRARLFKALLIDPSSTQLANLLLLAPKPVPHVPSPSESRKNILLASSSLVIGPDVGMHGMHGYEELPDWVDAGHEPNPQLRDEQDSKPEHAAERPANTNILSEFAASSKENNGRTGGTSYKDQSLDEWLAEEEEGSEETETGSETESDAESNEEGGLIGTHDGDGVPAGTHDEGDIDLEDDDSEDE